MIYFSQTIAGLLLLTSQPISGQDSPVINIAISISEMLFTVPDKQKTAALRSFVYMNAQRQKSPDSQGFTNNITR